MEVEAAILHRYLATHENAVAGKLSNWEQTAEGALALVLVLDQFPRNMFRDTARAYAADPLARAAAGRAIARRFDHSFANPERRFFYLPFMHSEDLADQERCISLCRETADAEGVTYAEIHAESSAASAASLTATRCSGAQRWRTSRSFSTRADLQADASLDEDLAASNFRA